MMVSAQQTCTLPKPTLSTYHPDSPYTSQDAKNLYDLYFSCFERGKNYHDDNQACPEAMELSSRMYDKHDKAGFCGSPGDGCPYWDASIDYNTWKGKCDAQAKVDVDLKALEEESNKLQAELDSLLDDITKICLGIEGCKPGNREDPDYINSIINDIIKLHSDSCSKGECIKVPITDLTNIADKIVAWNRREAAMESKISGLPAEAFESKTKETFESRVVHFNPDILTPDILINLKEENAKPVKESKLEQGSQSQETKKTLYEKFALKEKRAVPGEISQAFDFYGKPIDSEKLKAGLSDSLPVVELQFIVKNLKEDHPFSAEMPEGLPLKKVILTPSGQISDATVTTTIIDISKRQLLREQGIPEPDPSHHELQYYLKIDTVVNKEETHPFKEALFEFFVPAPAVLTPDYYDRVKVLRYIENNKEWIELPTERDKIIKCEFSFCGYAESPGTSYFAIVVEKETKSFLSVFLRIIFLVGLVFGVYYLVKRIREEKKMYGIKNNILRIVCGALIVIALFLIAAFPLFIIEAILPKYYTAAPSTLFFILIAALYFIYYNAMKFKKMETSLGFGARFWLMGAVIWMVLAILTHIYYLLV